MKKMLAVVAILMLVPFSAFGMEMMADTALEDVTGQAGVTISIDNVQMDFAMNYLSWGDTDGFLVDTDSDGIPDASLGAGYVNLSQIKMTGIVIDKLIIGNSGLTPIALDGTTVDTEIMENNVFNPFAYDITATGANLAYLTIDVGTAPLS